MRLSFQPYTLTQEDTRRLVAVLGRHGGSRTVRDLSRRHRFWSLAVLEAAAAAGFIRIEKRQPRTGRPSHVAVLEPVAVNKTPSAKLPRRRDVPSGLTFQEEDFLMRYSCRRGCSFFGGGRNAGSAADAYRKTYGRHHIITDASARSAGARLMRQPWMKAAFLLDRRLMHHGGRLHYPADMHSAGWQWLQLIRALDREFADWSADVGHIIRHAHTCLDACDEMLKLERFCNQPR